MIDAPDIAPSLQDRGYAAVSGSFGQPVIVPAGAGCLPLNLSVDDLPGYTEQEIIVADLAGPTPQKVADQPIVQPGPGVDAVWAPTARGLVDPRPARMRVVRSALDRIYGYGGVFIIFAAGRVDPECIMGALNRYGSLEGYNTRLLHADNWSLLSELQWLSVISDTGQEMDVADNGVARILGIENYFNGGHFECVIKPPSSMSGRWETLATNKYGDPVAGMILPGKDTTNGWIFILPQVERRAELVADLVDRVLPAITPRLFPHAEGSRWTRRDEYDLPRVSGLRDQILRVEEETRVKVRDFEEQIEIERTKFGFMHDLISASGKELVQAVIHALKAIGFNDVRDVDAVAQAAGDNSPRREDLHIMDARFPLLVEVKGIAGMPKESDAMQVVKYLIPRMKEWNRTDIRGLVVINHQRHLPALDRENAHVFQADVISNSQEQDFGLLTAWDLFRLVRGFIAHSWRHEDIANLFAFSGRVQPVPSHYKFLGVVEEYWEKASALGLLLQSEELRIGDRISYDLPVDFVEEDVISLQLEGQDIETAGVGDHVGLKTALSKQQARKGVRVFRVERRTLTN